MDLVKCGNSLCMAPLFSLFYSGQFTQRTLNRYVTKIKNCSGFMKVDHILKVWFSLSLQILISSKSVELKKTMGQIPAAPPIYTSFLLKIFSKQKFTQNFEFFGKPASYPFRKVIYVPANYLKLRSYSENFNFTLPIFSKFQLWSHIQQ